MCHFIPEVTKLNRTSEYPGKSLYQMCIAIQKFLNQNGIPWKLVEGSDFCQLRSVLDNVVKQRASENIGNVAHQANVISYELENEMWQKGLLGEDTPDKLREKVLFLLGIHLALHAGDEHYALRRDEPDRPSQLSFRRNEKGQHCLVYHKDTVTKTNDGGLANLRKELKIVWIFP